MEYKKQMLVVCEQASIFLSAKNGAKDKELLIERIPGFGKVYVAKSS